MPDTYQIIIRHSVPFSIGALKFEHTEVAFLRNGELMLALNGNPYDRQTGLYDEPSARRGDSTLRIAAYTAGPNLLYPYGDPSAPGTVLYETQSEEEIIRLAAIASDTARFINAQNIDYAPAGIVTQNCNSAAISIINALGLKIPSESQSLSKIGINSPVTLASWKPPSATMSSDALVAHLQNNLAQLRESAVQTHVRQDPNPYEFYLPFTGQEESSMVRFQRVNLDRPVPVADRQTPNSKPIAQMGALYFVQPTLDQMNSSASIQHLIQATLELYIKHTDPNSEVNRDQLQHIITTQPAAVADVLRDCKTLGLLPEAMNPNNSSYMAARDALNLYINALDLQAGRAAASPTSGDPTKPGLLGSSFAVASGSSRQDQGATIVNSLGSVLDAAPGITERLKSALPPTGPEGPQPARLQQ